MYLDPVTSSGKSSLVQEIAGSGDPVAVHVSVKGIPTVPILYFGFFVIRGKPAGVFVTKDSSEKQCKLL